MTFSKMVAIVAQESRPCTEHTELWMSDLTDDERIARGLCQQCPVRTTCLEIAITPVRTGEYIGPYGECGVWGGMNPAERRKYVTQPGYTRPAPVDLAGIVVTSEVRCAVCTDTSVSERMYCSAACRNQARRERSAV